jgi:alpha-N-arabinofuranosidase
MPSVVTVERQRSIDRISENVYSHFAEHLGRCIYGGIWVGEDDRVPTEDGIRTDTVGLLQDIDIPVLRWPGGCFADDYHWEDGVGPREERPTNRNLWWAQGRDHTYVETNEFGTDEFMRLCDMLDTEPFLAANVGSATPEEALNWVEYCNSDDETDLTQRRAENGSEEPYNVNYWGIGNENWGCGGRYAPDEYADQYRHFANYLNGFDDQINPGDDLEFVACGHITDEWNEAFFERLDDGMEFGPGTFLGMGSPYYLMDHFSVHRYYQAGDHVDFSDEEHYRIFARAQKVADDIDNAAETIESHVPGSEDVEIIVDEWGVWHPNATPQNGLEQENTVRDALTAAGVLDMMHERADVISMANIAQTVNVLQCLVQTDEEDAWKTPTFHVFDLYQGHTGNTAVEVDIETDKKYFDDEDHDVPLVSASASESDDELYVTVSNRSIDNTETVELDLGDSLGEASAAALFEDHGPRDYSTKENAEAFGETDIGVSVGDDGVYEVEVPPSSVVGVTVEK